MPGSRPLISLLLWLIVGPSMAATAGKTEAQLRALKGQIDRVSRQVGQDALNRDRLARNLRSAELAVTGARSELDVLHAQEIDHATRRTALSAERARVSASLARERAGLATQLQVAYQMGRREPLQLLLNQRDLAATARMVTWYGYFSRARAAQIAGIAQQVLRIDSLDAALAAQEHALADIRSARQSRLVQLESGRAQRQSALSNLQTEARSRAASLARLRGQQGSLEKLLRELTRVIRPRTSDPGALPDYSSEFGKLRGRLAWPVAGQVVASFGDTRASGVRWDGMVVATQHAAPVRAVAAGRLIYADWLPGLGLLAIVDHGSGYLSLYGYNDQLRKSAGETVVGGEIIAAAGDTGGRPEPQLYFEIRRAGKPVDPRPWFRQRRP